MYFGILCLSLNWTLLSGYFLENLSVPWPPHLVPLPSPSRTCSGQSVQLHIKEINTRSFWGSSICGKCIVTIIHLHAGCCNWTGSLNFQDYIAEGHGFINMVVFFICLLPEMYATVAHRLHFTAGAASCELFNVTKWWWVNDGRTKWEKDVMIWFDLPIWASSITVTSFNYYSPASYVRNVHSLYSDR